MITFYIVIFIVGVLYTFVSLVINGIGGIFNLGGHIGHIDSGSHLGHIDASGHSHAGPMDTHFGHNHSGLDSANTHLEHHIGHGHGSGDSGSGNGNGSSSGNSSVSSSCVWWIGYHGNKLLKAFSTNRFLWCISRGNTGFVLIIQIYCLTVV
jgi:hypothetical protein